MVVRVISPYQSTCLQIRIAALLIIAQPVGLANDQDPPTNPEVIQELLETMGRLTRSSWGECPYLGLRARYRPSFVHQPRDEGVKGYRTRVPGQRDDPVGRYPN